jgi:hypothetical protein
MTGITSGAWTAYPSGALVHPGFYRSSCYSIFSFMCMFCRSLFALLYLCFGHCVVWPSSIYAFWLPFWYLETLLIKDYCNIRLIDNYMAPINIVLVKRLFAHSRFDSKVIRFIPIFTKRIISFTTRWTLQRQYKFLIICR